MERSALVQQLTVYRTAYKEEQSFVPLFLKLLDSPRCYFRDHLPGHITGSAWITTPDFNEVVLVHHAKLQRWLQPGGHADGDENILNVALKEALEETGLNVQPAYDSFFDIDIHRIPARNDFPEHYHYDVRFLFHIPAGTPLQMSEESTELKWVPLALLESFNHDKSVVRMKEKLLRTDK